jgi:hypothetical protein
MATLDEHVPHDLEKSLMFEEQGSPHSETDTPRSVGPQEELHGSEGPQDRGTSPTERVNPTEWTGPGDSDNPHNWVIWKRIYHAIIPALFGFAV